MKISFHVPGDPVPKARPHPSSLKKCRKCGRQTMSWQCKCGSTDLQAVADVVVADAKTQKYESWVSLVASQAGVGRYRTYTGAVLVAMDFYFCIPRSRTKKLREGDRYNQRPDTSNLVKAIEDGLIGLAFNDDCQIHLVHAFKWWTRGEPGATVELDYVDLPSEQQLPLIDGKPEGFKYGNGGSK